MAIETSIFLKASFIVYIVPIIAMIGVAALSQLLFKNDIINSLSGIISFILSIFFIRVYSRKSKTKYLPYITKILEN